MSAVGLHLFSIDEEVVYIIAELQDITSNLKCNALNEGKVFDPSGPDMKLEAKPIEEVWIVNKN